LSTIVRAGDFTLGPYYCTYSPNVLKGRFSRLLFVKQR
jgi:hypothetical protein